MITGGTPIGPRKPPYKSSILGGWSYWPLEKISGICKSYQLSHWPLDPKKNGTLDDRPPHYAELSSCTAALPGASFAPLKGAKKTRTSQHGKCQIQMNKSQKQLVVPSENSWKTWVSSNCQSLSTQTILLSAYFRVTRRTPSTYAIALAVTRLVCRAFHFGTIAFHIFKILPEQMIQDIFTTSSLGIKHGNWTPPNSTHKLQLNPFECFLDPHLKSPMTWIPNRENIKEPPKEIEKVKSSTK